jgi:DNA oxidative demethylase
MTRKRNTTADLFAAPQAPRESLGADALLLRGFARGDACALFEEVQRIAALAPFRHMVTPGGYRMSVEMTNCGAWGWITDRRGYRYAAEDPETSRAWPAMPQLFSDLASRAATEAGFAGIAPDACLINRYTPGARLTLHQDKNERDFAEPIVSISLGLPATFLWGGLTRKERPRRFRLASGDVVVWGGASRLVFHGIDELEAGDDPLTGPCRINLTLRRAR